MAMGFQVVTIMFRMQMNEEYDEPSLEADRLLPIPVTNTGHPVNVFEIQIIYLHLQKEKKKHWLTLQKD